jgi:hypothetical protein
VVIAVSPAAPAPSLVRALEGACTEAVRPERCAVRNDVAPDVVVAWTAERTARIDATAAGASSRVLAFREQDAPEEVWRSIGLVVASLVRRTSNEPAPPNLEPPPRPAELPTVWLEGGAVVGSGVEHGPVSFGGTLRGGYRLPLLPVFVTAGGTYALAGTGPSGLDAKWTTLAIGAGGVLALSDFALRPRLELVFAELVAETRSTEPAGTSGSRKLGGAGAGLEVVWPARRRFGMVLGAEGTFLSSGTSIRLGDTRVSAFPALEYRFFVGLQVAVLR